MQRRLVEHDAQFVTLHVIDVSVKLTVSEAVVVAVTSIVYAPTVGPVPPKVRVAGSKVSPVGSED